MFSRSLRRSATLLVLAFIVAAALAMGANSHPTANTDETQVVETVRTFFDAATTDDLEKFHSVVNTNFYAFDGGQRFEGDALMDLIKSLHQKGNVFVWTINDPEVHVSGNFAWIAYVNRGSVKSASGTQNLTWLESAVLEKSDRWRVRFLHSTPSHSTPR